MNVSYKEEYEWNQEEYLEEYDCDYTAPISNIEDYGCDYAPSECLGRYE